jgi:hypothetical protein
MSPVFKSGAFAQQCFSSHPLCLSLKRLDPPERVIIACSSCNLIHRLRVRSFTVHQPALRPLPPEIEDTPGDLPQVRLEERPATDLLLECSAAHQAALGIWAMDVLQDSVGLRCTDCHRSYDLDVSEFETFQR